MFPMLSSIGREVGLQPRGSPVAEAVVSSERVTSGTAFGVSVAPAGRSALLAPAPGVMAAGSSETFGMSAAGKMLASGTKRLLSAMLMDTLLSWYSECQSHAIEGGGRS